MDRDRIQYELDKLDELERYKVALVLREIDSKISKKQVKEYNLIEHGGGRYGCSTRT